MQTAKLFKNGQSQAVRLPKLFRFEGSEVYIKKQGTSVILTPKEESNQEKWEKVFAAIDKFSPDFKIERHQPPMQERDFNFDD